MQRLNAKHFRPKCDFSEALLFEDVFTEHAVLLKT